MLQSVDISRFNGFDEKAVKNSWCVVDSLSPPASRPVLMTMSSRLSDYDYPLPEDLIAKRPLPRRDESRMMVLHRDSETIEHRQFRDLKAFLKPGDLLVLNNTRVPPARRFSDDHAVEFLFLEK